MFRIKFLEEIISHILCLITLPKAVSFVTYCGKIWFNQTDDRLQYTSVRVLCMLDNYKATDLQLEYVKRIAFPQQQWFRERVSVLGYR
jgi:hypothetical protein